MPFVPDSAGTAPARRSGFVPDAPAAPRPEEPGYIESAVRGGLQGVTLGFSDEIGGGLQAVIDKVSGDAGSLQDLYHKERDDIRRRNAAAAAANPVTYHGASLAAGLLVPIPGGAEASVARMAASGAALGGLAGAGFSEGQTPGEIAKDALVGGATGGLAGAAGAGIARAATSAPVTEALTEAGEHAARTHLRGGVSPLTSVRKPISEEAIQAAREAGAFGGKNIKESVAALDAAQGKAGTAVQDVVSRLDQQGVRSTNLRDLAERWMSEADQIESATLGDPRPTLIRERAAELLKKLDPEGLQGKYDVARAGAEKLIDKQVPNLQPAARERLINQILDKQGISKPVLPSDVPLSVGEGFKSSVQNAGKHSKLEADLLLEAERKMGMDLRAGNEAAVAAQLGPDAAQEFISAKASFSSIEEARAAAERGAAMFQNRSPIGMSEFIAMATGHPMGALATHAVKTRGMSAAASGLMSTAEKLTQVARTAPRTLGKYASVLQRAALQGGEEEVARKHFVLNNTDPAYRQMVAGLNGAGGHE